MNILNALVVEHGMMRDALDHLERVVCAQGSIEGIMGSATTLHHMLQLHAITENRLLLPAIRSVGDQGSDSVDLLFSHQHTRLDLGFSQLLAAEDVTTARAVCVDLLEALRTHFDEEEELLFPLAWQRLGEGLLHDLGRKWARSRHLIEGRVWDPRPSSQLPIEPPAEDRQLVRKQIGASDKRAGPTDAGGESLP